MLIKLSSAVHKLYSNKSDCINDLLSDNFKMEHTFKIVK